jgi:transposase
MSRHTRRINRNTDVGWPNELIRSLATLPPGRRRIAWALLADPCGATYSEVALRLGLHLGTVYQHLRRIRRLHPQVYAVLMATRSRQLEERHERALARAKAHTNRWFMSRLPIAGTRSN